MKKIILFFIFFITLISCGRDAAKSVEEEMVTTPSPELVFELSTVGNTSNLQIGDRLEVLVEVGDESTTGAYYILKPKTDNAVFHQKIGYDFLLHEIKDSAEPETQVNHIKILPSELKRKFFIEILRPGSFQHEYILEKYVDNRKVSSSTRSILFNAVKITAWTCAVQLRNGTLFRSSLNRRYYKFVIDDGDEQFDSYLTSSTKIEQTYEVNYAGEWHTEANGSITANQEKSFRWEEEREGKDPDVPATVISELKIKQVLSDGTINNISYTNIPVSQKHGC